MKTMCRSLLFISFVALHEAVEYGPSNCVTLSKSAAGSCVISTNCEAHVQELQKFEFVFDCKSSTEQDIVQHSFGAGGFDANEEFDTEVKCDTCSVPTPTNLVHKQPAKGEQAKTVQPPALAKVAPAKAPKTYASLHNYKHIAVAKAERPKTLVGMYRAKQAKALTAASESAAAQVKKLEAETAKVAEDAKQKESEEKETEEKDTEEEEVVDTRDAKSRTVRYGPNDCVSTYRSKEGHCIMKTDCDGEDIKNYTFGVVCVDKTGSPVRHLFGTDSFDPEETFDSLIACEQCLGLDDIPQSVSLNAQVMQLTGAVAGLGDLLKNISKSVNKLNAEVFADKKVEDKSGTDSNANEKAADETENEQTDTDGGSDADGSESASKDGNDSGEVAQTENTEEAKTTTETDDGAKESAPATEQDAPAAENQEATVPSAAPAAAPADTTEQLPALIKFHGARRAHKHTRRAARHHKHTRRAARAHKHHVATAHQAELPVAKATTLAPRKVPLAQHDQPAGIVEAHAHVVTKHQTTRLRASANAQRQQAEATSVASSNDQDDEDDSDDSQDESVPDNTQPRVDSNMQQQGDAQTQTLQSLDDSVQTVHFASQQTEQQMPASSDQDQADNEQDDEGSSQRVDDDQPAEDRNGFDSDDKFN